MSPSQHLTVLPLIASPPGSFSAFLLAGSGQPGFDILLNPGLDRHFYSCCKLPNDTAGMHPRAPNYES
jgi:hypothetical protein